ncbi:hypothetical protein HDV03_003420 [Kappamyces sp. JEL0829]|nr:hypothetical protein HDV03_003420 [Kappamyces sp. JEL0829]
MSSTSMAASITEAVPDQTTLVPNAPSPRPNQSVVPPTPSAPTTSPGGNAGGMGRPSSTTTTATDTNRPVPSDVPSVQPPSAPASTAPSSNLGSSSNDPAAGSLNGPATGSHDSPGSATPQESATPPTLNPSGGGSASIPITEPVSSSPGASDSVSSSTSTLTLAISIGAVGLFVAGVATLAIYERSRRAKHPDPEDGRPPAPMSLYIPALDYTPPPLKHTVSVPFESMHLEAIDRAYVPSRRVDVDSELFWSDDYMENMTTGFESLRRPLSSLTLESDQVTDDSENIKPLTHYKSIKHLLNDLPDPDM